MRPALEFMLSKSKEADESQVESFAHEAVNDFIYEVKHLPDAILPQKIKEKVLEKLALIDILPGVFAHNFTDQQLDEYYDELSLTGDESMVATAIKIQEFQRKIKNDFKFLFTKGSKSSLDSSAHSDLLSYNTLTDELRKFSLRKPTFDWGLAANQKFFIFSFRTDFFYENLTNRNLICLDILSMVSRKKTQVFQPSNFILGHHNSCKV